MTGSIPNCGSLFDEIEEPISECRKTLHLEVERDSESQRQYNSLTCRWLVFATERRLDKAFVTVRKHTLRLIAIPPGGSMHRAAVTQ